MCVIRGATTSSVLSGGGGHILLQKPDFGLPLLQHLKKTKDCSKRGPRTTKCAATAEPWACCSHRDFCLLLAGLEKDDKIPVTPVSLELSLRAQRSARSHVCCLLGVKIKASPALVCTFLKRQISPMPLGWTFFRMQVAPQGCISCRVQSQDLHKGNKVRVQIENLWSSLWRM